MTAKRAVAYDGKTSRFAATRSKIPDAATGI